MKNKKKNKHELIADVIKSDKSKKKKTRKMLWNYDGEFFGYRKGNRIWTYKGKNIGIIKSKTGFDRDAIHTGAIYDNDCRNLGVIYKNRVLCLKNPPAIYKLRLDWRIVDKWNFSYNIKPIKPQKAIEPFEHADYKMFPSPKSFIKESEKEIFKAKETKKAKKRKVDKTVENVRAYVPRCICECVVCEDYGFHCKKRERGCRY